jgi:long-chain fatty acid transport protein
MRESARKILAGLVVSFSAGFLSLGAQDLSSFELGARASGMAGAFTAKADDATAVFSNPAGLAFLSGFRFKANLIFSLPNITASSSQLGVGFTSAPSQFRGSFALSWQFVKRLNVGIGVFVPYAFDSDWPFKWVGRYTSIKAGMSAVYLRPVFSAEIVRGLALGIGVDFVFSRLSWRHDQPFHLGNFPLTGEVGIDSRFELKGTGTGFVAGLLWKPHPIFRAGVRYQQQVPVDFRGWDRFAIPNEDVGWMTVPDPVKPFIPLVDLLPLFYRSQDFAGRLKLPREVVFGAAFAPTAALSFHLDLQWDGWSRFGAWQFRAVNDDQNLSPSFTTALQDFYGISPDYGLQTAGLVLKDAWKIKAGVEYRPTPYLALRGGFAHHQSPSGNASLNPIDPVPGLNTASVGFGYEGPVFSLFSEKQIAELSFDVFFRYAYSAEGSGTIASDELTFRARRWDFGVGVGLDF